MFPDEMHGSSAPLFAIGAMSLVGRAALATQQQRQQTLQQLKRRTSKLPQRVRQAAGEVTQGMCSCNCINASSKFQVKLFKAATVPQAAGKVTQSTSSCSDTIVVANAERRFRGCHSGSGEQTGEVAQGAGSCSSYQCNTHLLSAWQLGRTLTNVRKYLKQAA